MIKIDYKDACPIHEQISRGIKELVMSGALATDEQLPSVRDFAVSLTVNPNTVQRAYKTLENEGIIYSVRGKGNFVSEISAASAESIEKLRDALFRSARELAFFGEERGDIIKIIDEAFRETEGEK